MNTEQGRQMVFGPFRFDLTTNQLWRGEQGVALQPKPLAVLRYLAERPGQVVTKQELLKHIWAGVYVTKAVLKTCVQAVRKALRDDATAPRYIETVGREGYRFVGAGDSSQYPVASSEKDGLTLHAQRTSTVVGREAELAQLQRWLASALRGERQLIFVTGEPGIGKTTLVDVFLERVHADGHIRFGRGQCLEQHGRGEAYLPVLEAFGRLCREPEGEQVVAVLRQHAPTWLIQILTGLPEAEFKALEEQVQGVTQARMLREMEEAIEVLTAERGMVLWFDDLQWSDSATAELIAYLAQRWDRARLLVIGMYRPADLVSNGHALKSVKQELQAKALLNELA